MIIKFDAQALASELDLIHSISSTKNAPTEELVGFHAKDGKLTAYAYGKGQWARIVTACTVEEEGLAITNRVKFFQLLKVLRGQIKLKYSGKGLIEITPAKGKYTLTSSRELPSKPNTRGMEDNAQVIAASPLYKQLKLGMLDGELIGGGYKLERKNTWLELTVSDRLRLVLARQKCEGVDFAFTVQPTGIKGVFDILKKATENVTIKSNTNLTSIGLVQENGTTLEFGFQNSTEVFPSVKQLTDISDYPNHRKFEVARLLDTIERSIVVADQELAFCDFTFLEDEMCNMLTQGPEGSAELVVENVFGDEELKQPKIRLRLDFITGFLRKAKESGAAHIDVSWGKPRPVRWVPDFDDPQPIELTCIMGELQKV